MTRLIVLVLGFSVLASAVACGGNGADPDRLLQLSAGQLTERELRSLIEESIVDDDELYEVLCAALAGLSDDQATEAFVLSYSRALAEQEIVIADEKRAVQITREECEAAGLS